MQAGVDNEDNPQLLLLKRLANMFNMPVFSTSISYGGYKTMRRRQEPVHFIIVQNQDVGG